MDLRQLEFFVRVTEEASFTRAAHLLRVAQPAVSTKIQQLEREVGQQLFDRSQRTIRLTAAGEAVLPYAKAALAAARNVQRALDDMSSLIRGTIRIGTVMSHHVDIPALIKSFHEAHPVVEITLRTATSDRMIEDIRSAQLDLAVIAIGPHEQPDGIAISVLAEESVSAAVSRGHELSERTTVTLRTLQNHPLIALPESTEIRRQFNAACRRAGFTPHIAFEVSTPSELTDLAAHDLGIAIIRQSLVENHAELHGLLIKPEIKTRIALAWRGSGPISPAARALIDVAKNILANT